MTSAPLQLPFSAEAALLCDALGIDADDVREFSREPLGQGTVAGFTVADGDLNATVYVDTSGIAVDAETGLAQDGVGRIWTHPADPHLPALAAAAFGSAAETLLGRLGITPDAAPVFVAYRPGRRAVLRLESDAGSVWIKIVRPRHVDRIVEAHRSLRLAGVPVPAVRAWSPSGLLVIEAAAGTPATDSPWQAGDLIDAVDKVRTALAGTPATRQARSAALTRVGWYSERIEALEPAFTSRVRVVAERLEETPNSHETTVHGDLHFGQLFLDDDARHVSGLIDVDTFGRGDAAEDPAAFLSHAAASLELARNTASEPRLRSLLAEGRARWGGDAAVQGRTAAQLLGHTVAALERGEAVRGERLLSQAEQWIRIAREK